MKLKIAGASPAKPEIAFELEQDSDDIHIVALLPNGKRQTVAFFHVNGERIFLDLMRGPDPNYFSVDSGGYLLARR